MIAHAKVKTDAIDAAVLAKPYASGFLPEDWIPDGRTLSLRRQVAQRTQLVRQRVRLKNLIQSVLHAHLIPPCPHGNLTGISGRRWLSKQVLPDDERDAVARHLAMIDLLESSIKDVDGDIARQVISDPIVRRLMTLPGIDITAASGVAAAVGDIRRFSDPQKLVAYLGLKPSVHQSGEGPAYHGRISKQGRGQARGVLVGAAWAAARRPRPLRAFFKRISSRRGQHVAAVATARKMTMIVWHMLTKEADYIWARPALLGRKFRAIELRAEMPAEHSKKGAPPTITTYLRSELRNGRSLRKQNMNMRRSPPDGAQNRRPGGQKLWTRLADLQKLLLYNIRIGWLSGRHTTLRSR